jgi:SAM-dependent methyltransferase
MHVQDDMIRDGYTSIINVDYSEAAIEQLKARPRRQGCVYEVVDVRDMPSVDSASIASLLDKGTLDAILCGAESFKNTARAVREYERVLAPKGVLLFISYGSPSSRLHHLAAEGLDWDVSVYAVSKLSVEEAAAAALGVAEPPVGVSIMGPCSDSAGIAGLEALPDVQFAYACVKREVVEESEDPD